MPRAVRGGSAGGGVRGADGILGASSQATKDHGVGVCTAAETISAFTIGHFGLEHAFVQNPQHISSMPKTRPLSWVVGCCSFGATGAALSGGSTAAGLSVPAPESHISSPSSRWVADSVTRSRPALLKRTQFALSSAGVVAASTSSDPHMVVFYHRAGSVPTGDLAVAASAQRADDESLSEPLHSRPASAAAPAALPGDNGSGGGLVDAAITDTMPAAAKVRMRVSWLVRGVQLHIKQRARCAATASKAACSCP